MICMNVDSTVVFRYISPLYDHPIVCDWAKIVSKITRKFSAFCRTEHLLQQIGQCGSGIMRIKTKTKPARIQF